jgi:MFS family permease
VTDLQSHPEQFSGLINPGIAAAIAAVGVFSLTIGLSYPLFSLILEQMGLPAAMIGLNAAMTPLGILVSAPVIPEVARRVRGDVLAIAAVLAVSGLLLLLGSLRDPVVWLGLRFLIGVAINTLYVLSETWINQLAPQAFRGRIIGIYGMVAAAGFALGPALLGFLGTGGMLPFAVAAAITVLPVPLLVAAGRYLPGTGGESRGAILDFVRRAPVLLFAVGAFALFDQATLSLLPIYGLAIGMDETRAAFALTILVAGNIVLQVPIGWLADRFRRRHVMAGLACLACLGALLLPLAAGHPAALWPLLFIWGAAGYGGYTVALTILGDRYTGQRLLAGNACFALMWGAGGIFGSPSAGKAMDLFGHNGLPGVLAALFAALALTLAMFRLTVERDPREG